LKQTEGSGTESSGSREGETSGDEEQDAEEEVLGVRFMTQKEKDMLWVAKQRKKMLRQSKRLEAKNLQQLEETRSKA